MPLLWNAIRASVITLNTFPTAGCIKVNTLLNKPVRIVKPFLISSSNRSVQYLCRPTAISSTRSITEGSQERRIMSTLFRRICNFGKRVATLKAAQIKIKEITIFDSPISSVSSSSGRARWIVKKMLQRWYALYVRWSRAKDTLNFPAKTGSCKQIDNWANQLIFVALIDFFKTAKATTP